jgi:biopolymer transport protein ExbD
MRPRRVSVRQRVQDATFEINLAPMLDMMCSLIPILLISMAFVHLVVIDSPVPQPVAEVMEKDKNDKDPELSIRIVLNDNKSVHVQLNEKGKLKDLNFNADAKGNFDLEKLYHEMLVVKLNHPEVFKLELNPAERVPYKDIIFVMDRLRMIDKKDPEVTVLDKEKNSKVSTRFMYPNITFGNIVEG